MRLSGDSSGEGTPERGVEVVRAGEGGNNDGHTAEIVLPPALDDSPDVDDHAVDPGNGYAPASGIVGDDEHDDDADDDDEIFFADSDESSEGSGGRVKRVGRKITTSRIMTLRSDREGDQDTAAVAPVTGDGDSDSDGIPAKLKDEIGQHFPGERDDPGEMVAAKPERDRDPREPLDLSGVSDLLKGVGSVAASIARPIVAVPSSTVRWGVETWNGTPKEIEERLKFERRIATWGPAAKSFDEQKLPEIIAGIVEGLNDDDKKFFRGEETSAVVPLVHRDDFEHIVPIRSLFETMEGHDLRADISDCLDDPDPLSGEIIPDTRLGQAIGSFTVRRRSDVLVGSITADDINTISPMSPDRLNEAPNLVLPGQLSPQKRGEIATTVFNVATEPPVTVATSSDANDHIDFRNLVVTRVEDSLAEARDASLREYYRGSRDPQTHTAEAFEEVLQAASPRPGSRMELQLPNGRVEHLLVDRYAVEVTGDQGSEGVRVTPVAGGANGFQALYELGQDAEGIAQYLNLVPGHSMEGVINPPNQPEGGTALAAEYHSVAIDTSSQPVQADVFTRVRAVNLTNPGVNVAISAANRVVREQRGLDPMLNPHQVVVPATVGTQVVASLEATRLAHEHVRQFEAVEVQPIDLSQPTELMGVINRALGRELSQVTMITPMAVDQRDAEATVQSVIEIGPGQVLNNDI